jgi:hypothetical protein
MSLTLSKKSRTDLPKNQDSPNFLRNFFLSSWDDIAYIRFPTIIILPVPLVFEKFTLILMWQSRTDLPKNQDSPDFLRIFFLSSWGDIAYIRFPTIIILPVPLVFEKNHSYINVSTILIFK